MKIKFQDVFSKCKETLLILTLYCSIQKVRVPKEAVGRIFIINKTLKSLYVQNTK